MKRWPAYATGAVLLLACLALYLFEPAFLRTLSSQSYDPFLRATAVPPRSGAVAVVDIDDPSLATWGQWPWPRYLVARLLDRLREAGAAVVAFDVVFSEPDRTSPARLREAWSDYAGTPVAITGFGDKPADFDTVFAEALGRSPTVLGCFLTLGRGVVEPPAEEDPAYRGRFFERGPQQRARLPQGHGVILPIPPLERAAGGVAAINTVRDLDNVVRSTPLVFARGSGRLYPALALEAVRLYRGAPTGGIVYHADGVSGVSELTLGALRVPVDGEGRLSLNFRSEPFPVVSAGDVLGGAADPAALRDRIVFVGSSAAGLQDIVATPLSPEFAGVGVQATAADNLLAGDALRAPGWRFTAGLLALALVGAALVVGVARSRALRGLLAVAVLVAATLALSYGSLAHAHRLVLPVEAILTWLVLYGGVTIVKFWQEERARHRVRSMFSTMVSDQVLHYMEDHPNSFSLRGERREVTVLFSDLVRFTPIAERMDPEALSAMMNQYLTPMTELVLEHRGYVNKFNGDAVMAVWGVPYAVDDHALQGALAAVGMLQQMDAMRPDFRARFGCELRMRIGLNTGPATAGNMGSEHRFEYTVLGDAVNQASRFETANKEYQSVILAGETTWEAAREHVEGRLIDRVVLVGKTRPVALYELLGRKGAVPAERLEMAARYEEGLRRQWERRWNEAVACFDRALALVPSDGPSRILRRRVLGYRKNPPPSDWSGAHVLRTK